MPQCPTKVIIMSVNQCGIPTNSVFVCHYLTIKVVCKPLKVVEYSPDMLDDKLHIHYFMSVLLLFSGSAGTQLFVYIQTIQSYLAPPITMVFGLGILWTGLTSAGALSGLLIGFVLGMAKFIGGNVYTKPDCGLEDTRPGFVKMHFMFYGEKLSNLHHTLEIVVYLLLSSLVFTVF